MRVTLVVPGLLSLPPDVLAREASLSRMAARASAVVEPDVESAILVDVGLDAAPAPLAALGAGVEVGTRWVARADPVSMIVGRDDARIENVVHDLDERERDELVALLDAHFADDGVSFAAPRADAWFALADAAQSVRSVSAESAIGSSLRELLPSGADAGRWRRWITETQMLLHEHALAARNRPVTSIWFSGGGVLPERTVVARVRAHADASAAREGDLLRGLARLRGSEASEPPVTLRDVLDSAAGADAAIVAVSRMDRPDALARFDVDYLAPALEDLDRGRIASLKLIGSGIAGAASWTACRGSWLQRLTRRRAVFAAPAS